MEKFSFEKAQKFSNKDKFFDINYVYSPGLSWTTEKLYYTSIRPEVVVLLALLSGLIAAWLYLSESYHVNLIAAFFILAKNYLDTVDGHLARAKNMTSRLGRFLDSLADAVVYICLFTVMGVKLSSEGMGSDAYTLSYIAMICAFLQCSIYNYYVVSYKTYLNGKGINRTDESFSEEDKDLYNNGLEGIALFVLQLIYQFVYAWQDRIITFIDSYTLKRFKSINHQLDTKEIDRAWYADKKFLVIVSPLSFGTQILFLSLYTLADNVAGFPWFIIIIGNIYAVIIMLVKMLSIKEIKKYDLENFDEIND